jgi:SAM-dependent methyltransferase
MMARAADEHEYVLGTHDEELARLGLQHRVWRPRALDAWRRGNFTVGQTIVDIGCGPGYASLDLAEIVGPTGRVIAIDQSQRFLDVVKAAARKNISTYKLDLDADDLPRVTANGAWVRWVFGFLKHPRELLERIAGILRPGATLVIHEYFDYGTWRFTRRSPSFEEFVATVMRSWRATGGEPDVGLDLSIWAEEVGFRLVSLMPIIEVITPSNFLWQWPKASVDVGLRRLIELGGVSEERAADIRREFGALEAMPHTKMITPGVLEIIAVKEE